MNKNPYFNTDPLPLKEEVRVENDFKQYEPAGEKVEGAPGSVPEKGLTSIIIPVYFNSYPVFHTTGNCIGSIREHTDKEKTPYEIIMVLQGNTGIKFGSLSDSKADKVIEVEENEGYAKAVNRGIRCARGEYIALINNDVQVFNHWLEDMQDAIYRGKMDLVMATPMYGMPFARALEAAELRVKSFGQSDGEAYEDFQTDTLSDFTDFSCVLTKKEMFNQIGLFDEQFFMYGEDLDLLRRMKEAELKYASTKRVNTHHIISMTASGVAETPDIMNESKEKLKVKWGY